MIAHLESKGFQVDDVGMKADGEFVPYHRAAAAVAKAVSEKQYDKGVTDDWKIFLSNCVKEIGEIEEEQFKLKNK